MDGGTLLHESTIAIACVSALPCEAVAQGVEEVCQNFSSVIKSQLVLSLSEMDVVNPFSDEIISQVGAAPKRAIPNVACVVHSVVRTSHRTCAGLRETRAGSR